jgi:hypothetical protein
MEIEYLKQFGELSEEGVDGTLTKIRERHAMVRRFSFAIPTLEAVQMVSCLSPLVEMGAGTGYWSMLVSASGGDILAFDKSPGEGNKYSFTGSYYNVLQGDERVIATRGRGRNLFLCWPNYNTDFAYNCLARFGGERFAYIGEGVGGCTANDKFFQLLEDKWRLHSECALPQWPGIHDRLEIYERIGVTESTR